MSREYRTCLSFVLVNHVLKHIHELGEAQDGSVALLCIDDEIEHKHYSFERADFVFVIHQRLKLLVELALLHFRVVAKHQLGNLFCSLRVLVDDLDQPAQRDYLKECKLLFLKNGFAYLLSMSPILIDSRWV